MPEGGERNDRITTGHCPSCGPRRSADVSALVIKHFEDHPALYGEIRHRLLTCRGCGEIYYQRGVVFSEDCELRHDSATGCVEEFYPERVSHWPAPTKRPAPPWKYQLDTGLQELLDEVYTALNNDARVLAALGMRTVFDRAAELLRVDPGLTFKEKLSRLQEMGAMGSGEGEALDILEDGARAAAHRGWKPAPQHLTAVMATLEQFMYRALVLPREAAKLANKGPQKP